MNVNRIPKDATFYLPIDRNIHYQTTIIIYYTKFSNKWWWYTLGGNWALSGRPELWTYLKPLKTKKMLELY